MNPNQPFNVNLFINASQWHNDTVQYVEFYSPDIQVMAFLKQRLRQATTLAYFKTLFRHFHKPFACLIIDHLTNECFLVRDHFGFEPFYYAILPTEPGQLCFGSNLPDILAHIQHPMPDEEQIVQILMDICISGLEYTDQTYYKNVFRVTPGHIVQVKTDFRSSAQKQVFWALEPGTQFIRYPADTDYDEHFAALLQEACHTSCQQAPDSVALEFSGGLDTSAILTTLDRLDKPARLFMHVGDVQDERWYGEQLVQELQSHYPIDFVNADDFDVMAVLNRCKQWFAGGAPYLFFMFAANIHQAVQQQGSRVLLSGFGGDECVSSHAPLRTWGAEIKFKSLWQELNTTTRKCSRIRQFAQYLKISHPDLYYKVQYIKSYRSALANKQAPIHYKPYKSLQEREADWLTGHLSHHVRMRIEYSAVVAKNMEFSYQYPLLYPPLVEFCFSLPPEQKRRLGKNRLLMRRYLDKKLPSGLFNQHRKCGNILPGTMPKCQELYKKGLLNDFLGVLPYQEVYDYMIKDQLITEDRLFHLDLLRYMFK